MEMNFAGTARPTSHLKKRMNPAICLIKMKEIMRKLMFCVKLVNLVIFRNRKRNFLVKRIVF